MQQVLPIRAFPKSHGYWNAIEPIGTGSSTGFLSDTSRNFHGSFRPQLPFAPPPSGHFLERL